MVGSWRIGRIHLDQITLDAGLDLLHPSLQLSSRKVPVPVIDGLELAAVDGHQRIGEQPKPLAQNDELPADAADGLAILLAEIGNGLVIRRQSPGQPHQFDIPLCLSFQVPAGLNPIEIAVDVELEKNRRMVGRPPCGRRLDTVEPHLTKIEFIDKDIFDANRIRFGNVVVEHFRQQRALCPTLTLNESLHLTTPSRCLLHRWR